MNLKCRALIFIYAESIATSQGISQSKYITEDRNNDSFSTLLRSVSYFKSAKYSVVIPGQYCVFLEPIVY